MAEESALIQSVRAKLSRDIVGYHSYLGDDTIIVRRESIAGVLKLLKEEFGFNMLMDLCGVDYFGQEPRFEVVYNIYSLEKNTRLRVKTQLNESEEVDTITHLWPIADWLERETWDMYGIVFKGHPNLKRLLMYDGFEGHALRKDYPINKRQPIAKMRQDERS
jgi:NADH-quinone oxidoreductase subunit C